MGRIAIIGAGVSGLTSAYVSHRAGHDVTLRVLTAPMDHECRWKIGPHYAETLRHWRERFARTPAEKLEALGFDERFRRLWRFYLSYMEAGFRERRIGDVQLVLAGPGFRDEAGLLRRVSSLPPTDAVRV